MGARSSKKQERCTDRNNSNITKGIKRHSGNVWLRQQQRQAVSVIAGRVFKAVWGKDTGCEAKLLNVYNLMREKN